MCDISISIIYESEYSSEYSLFTIYLNRRSYFEMWFICNTSFVISPPPKWIPSFQILVTIYGALGYQFTFISSHSHKFCKVWVFSDRIFGFFFPLHKLHLAMMEIIQNEIGGLHLSNPITLALNYLHFCFFPGTVPLSHQNVLNEYNFFHKVGLFNVILLWMR